VHADVYDPDAGYRRDDFAARVGAPAVADMPGLGFVDAFDDLG
ncbi:ATP-binding protein, partial [Streptomyces sp. TRM76130]|nr:ATP-binding protein [Streptomyces sp. TRM76130]